MEQNPEIVMSFISAVVLFVMAQNLPSLFCHFLRPVYLAPNLYRMTTDREPFARPTGLRTNCLRDRGLVHGLPSLELGTLAIQSCAFPRGGKVRLHCLGCPTSQMTSGMSL